VVEHARSADHSSDQPPRPLLRFLGLDWDPHRLIYGTIILMVALGIYEESDDVFDQGTLLELLAVVIAPLFALLLIPLNALIARLGATAREKA